VQPVMVPSGSQLSGLLLWIWAFVSVTVLVLKL
jgi:hypothetical protein